MAVSTCDGPTERHEGEVAGRHPQARKVRQEQRQLPTHTRINAAHRGWYVAYGLVLLTDTALTWGLI
jgi:hypothetical protein